MASSFLFSPNLFAGLAPAKEIPAEYKDHIRKFLPAIRNPIYKMEAGAQHLEDWIDDVLEPAPLLDVSARLAQNRSIPPPPFWINDVTMLQ